MDVPFTCLLGSGERISPGWTAGLFPAVLGKTEQALFYLRSSSAEPAVRILSRKDIKNTNKCWCFLYGSGERIRTFDLVVTLIHCFRSGVDYIITLRLSTCYKNMYRKCWV